MLRFPAVDALAVPGALSPRKRRPGSDAGPGLFVGLAILSGAGALLTADWIDAVAILVLCAGWRFLRAREGPPVLAMAFTFQWVQVTAGLWYAMLTGIRLPAVDQSDYRPAVLIGLGCLVACCWGSGSAWGSFDCRA